MNRWIISEIYNMMKSCGINNKKQKIDDDYYQIIDKQEPTVDNGQPEEHNIDMSMIIDQDQII